MTVGLNTTNLAHQWLNWLRGVATTAPAGTFVRLHLGDPGAAGTSNGSTNTTRVAATFSAAAGGAIALSNTPTWASWANGAETISHISVWDAASAGNFLFSVALTSSKAITNGDTFTLTTLGFSLAPIAA